MMATSRTLLGAADGVRSGTVSSEELVLEALKRVEETEADVGAFLSVQGRAAVDAAREVDRKVRVVGDEKTRMRFCPWSTPT